MDEEGEISAKSLIETEVVDEKNKQKTTGKAFIVIKAWEYRKVCSCGLLM